MDLCPKKPFPQDPKKDYVAIPTDRSRYYTARNAATDLPTNHIPYHQHQDRHGRPFGERLSTKRAETVRSTEPEHQKSQSLEILSTRQQQNPNLSPSHRNRQDTASQQYQLPRGSNRYEQDLRQAEPRRGNLRKSPTGQIWREKPPSLVNQTRLTRSPLAHLFLCW
ncbi:unnamed protein product [Microthlaspi erraticum]|uniref:Uncharacterized protein n=1 Tax=Microthlaspi erraticum TaxID=1685480 RepID=A0A6D2I932_9BRAS|nr:unnamed protein product [Microthlaspi erraticum]